MNFMINLEIKKFYRIRNTSLREVITTDAASCFDASRLSSITSAADIPYYIFSKVAIFPESYGSCRDCWLWVYNRRKGRIWTFGQTPLHQFCFKVCTKVGGVFWGASLQDMFFHKTGSDKLLDKAKSSRLSLVHSIVVVYTDTEENNGSCT